MTDHDQDERDESATQRVVGALNPRYGQAERLAHHFVAQGWPRGEARVLATFNAWNVTSMDGVLLAARAFPMTMTETSRAAEALVFKRVLTAQGKSGPDALDQVFTLRQTGTSDGVLRRTARHLADRLRAGTPAAPARA